MTDIEPYTQPANVVVRDHQSEAVARLAEWASSAQAAMAVAEQLSRSSFVPEAFRNKPGEATAAILAGLEVGLQPMAALRSFDVIQGQAAPRAVTLRAILQSHGHEIELVESTATRCKMRGRRRGASAWQDVTWTMDRARQLDLGNKPNWKKQPQAMLVARCTSELARLIASDAILGVAYSAEEIGDGAGAGVEVPADTTADPDTLAGAAPGTKRMSRKKAAAPKPAAAKDAEPADDPDAAVTDAVELADDDRLDAIQARITDLAQEDREDLVAWWKGKIPPLRSGDLTVEHAEQVDAAIDAYNQAGTDPAAGRNRKMWAMVAEAWPTSDEPERDELRRHLIGFVTEGRTESSKDLAPPEWDGLFEALTDITAGTHELFLDANERWIVRKSPTNRRSA